MDILINESPTAITQPCSVEHLLKAIGQHEHRGLAIAINDTIIPRSSWATHMLQEADRVTLIRAAAGG